MILMFYFIQMSGVYIRNIPNYDELLEYVPESQYTRNAVTSARRNTRTNSITPIVGGNFIPSLEAEFKIAASQSCMLNLAECYFTIAGWMQGANKQQFQMNMKAGPLWILKCINKIALSIGGTNIYTIQTPALLAKYREIFAQSVHDIKNGSQEQEGYPRDADGVSKSIQAPGGTVQITTAKYGAKADGKYPVEETGEVNQPVSVPTSVPTAGGSSAFINPGTVFFAKPETDSTKHSNDAGVNFIVNLKLTDIFPIENMKPIFGQDVRVYITFDSAGFTGILDADGYSPIIQSFHQFFLNVITYNVNVDMIAKLNNVYSKQVIEIIDDVNYNFQGITSIGNNQQVDIYIPLQTQFETDMIYIAMPHAISNNEMSGATFTPLANRAMWTANWTDHTPMDYRFMNIRRIVVEADGEILYMRAYDEVTYGGQGSLTGGVGAIGPKDITVNATGFPAALTDDNQYASMHDYLTAYEDYKQCRYYHGVLEEKAQTFEDWVFSGFGIAIPVRAFSRLTTGSNLRISINFGDGTREGAGQKSGNVIPVGQNFSPTGSISVTTANQHPAGKWLKNLLVIQKSTKALVFNGFNNCSIKNIAQSFEQDLIVETKESTDITPQ
jgi:hypothetical protein